MLAYLDSSVVLRAVLPGPGRAAWRRWLDTTVTRFDAAVSSRLLRTEVVRVLRREQFPLVDGDKVLSRIRLISVIGATFQVAESIEPNIRTLDALHLATALVIGRPLIVVTHDATMTAVADAVGLQTFDPVGVDDTPLAIPRC